MKKPSLNRMTPLLMLIPATIGIGIVQVIPSLQSIWMSLFDVQLLKPGKPFIGLKNYVEILSQTVTFKVMANTIVFAVFSLFFASALAMLAAVELNKNYPGRSLLRTLFLVPWVTPPLVTSMIWKILVNGSFSPFNVILKALGLIDKPMNLLGQTKTFLGVFSVPMLTIIVINIWSMFPFMMVMFLAGLQTIPQEMYEAAEVDGANGTTKFWRLTLPLLKPVISTSILLQGIWQLNNFNISYLVTKGGPLNMTEVMAVRVYSDAFVNFRYGRAAAYSVIMLIIAIPPAIYYIWSINRQSDY